MNYLRDIETINRIKYIKTFIIILSIVISLSSKKINNIDFIAIQNIYKKNIQIYYDNNYYFKIKNNNSTIKTNKNNYKNFIITDI